ncbi:MAG: LytTR family transcriptional regulator [Rhodobacter sp.]|nr:LytTR family transcriptional regulator [Paracoccaceae bacterium]MCC0077922.1 LytTR family transcriptional regulator [Rhodobacter sp.]
MSTPERPESRLLQALHPALPWAWRRFLWYWRSARFWMVIATACLVGGLAGPMQTNTLPASMRLVYWTTLVVPSILLVLIVSLILRETARNLNWHWEVAAAIAGLFCVGPIIGLTMALDWLLMPLHARHPQAQLISSIVALVLPITLTANAFLPTLQPLGLFRRRAAPPAGPRPETPLPGHPITADPEPEGQAAMPAASTALATSRIEGLPLFERLPPELGQDIVSVRADNHHIEVTTTLGQARVLMRLGDAESDLSTLPGMRVHRSWWVNLAHVGQVDKGTSGTLELVTSAGVRIPVARTQRETVQARLMAG